jgi:hypothetical protein
MINDFAPGAIVRLPAEPDRGDGMVESATGNPATVNFQHAGMRTIGIDVATLELVSADDRA